MSIRYHQCGWPVQVEETWHGSHGITYYDWNEGDGRRRVTTCLRCGEHLTADTLCVHAPLSASALRAWTLMWPQLRQQIEGQIVERSFLDPQFYTYHAEKVVTEFEESLNNIAHLAARLSEEHTVRRR